MPLSVVNAATQQEISARLGTLVPEEEGKEVPKALADLQSSVV